MSKILKDLTIALPGRITAKWSKKKQSTVLSFCSIPDPVALDVDNDLDEAAITLVQRIIEKLENEGHLGLMMKLSEAINDEEFGKL